jgi:hypothetical protein
MLATAGTGPVAKNYCFYGLLLWIETATVTTDGFCTSLGELSPETLGLRATD